MVERGVGLRDVEIEPVNPCDFSPLSSFLPILPPSAPPGSDALSQSSPTWTGTKPEGKGGVL